MVGNDGSGRGQDDDRNAARTGGLRAALVPQGRRRRCRGRRLPPRRPLDRGRARRPTRSRPRTPSRGPRRASGTRTRTTEHRGLRHRHQRQRRRDRVVQGRHRRHRVPDPHLPHGLVPGTRRPAGWPSCCRRPPCRRSSRRRSPTPTSRADPRPAWSTAATGPCPPSWQVPADAVSGVYFANFERLDRPGLTNRAMFVVRNDGRADRPAGADVGHDDARLQPVGRQQPVLRRDARPGLQGQLQPAVPHRRPRERVLGRRVPAGAVARAQRVRRRLHDLRRHRPARRGAAQAPGLRLVGPRRVLVAGPAGQRRGRPRRRRPPRVHGGQRGLLEDPLGGEHGPVGHRPPHPRLLQGDARGRQARPDARVDGHVARPPVQPAVRRRPARAPAHRPDLRRHQRRDAARPDHQGPRRVRGPAVLAPHRRGRARRPGRPPR